MFHFLPNALYIDFTNFGTFIINKKNFRTKLENYIKDFFLYK